MKVARSHINGQVVREHAVFNRSVNEFAEFGNAYDELWGADDDPCGVPFSCIMTGDKMPNSVEIFFQAEAN